MLKQSHNYTQLITETESHLIFKLKQTLTNVDGGQLFGLHFYRRSQTNSKKHQLQQKVVASDKAPMSLFDSVNKTLRFEFLSSLKIELS